MMTTCCPAWCGLRHRHVDPLEPFHTGPSWPTITGVYPSGDSRVTVCGGKVDPFEVVVELALDNDGVTLTPGQARRIARNLIEAADWADAHRDD